MTLKDAALYAAVALVAAGGSLWLTGGSSKKGPDTSNWLPARKADLHAAPLTAYEEQVPFLESDWLDQHWETPIPWQGEPPEDWSTIESDLSPETCGMCHPTQYADWKESWHANAMGPGLMGQLLERDTLDDNYAEICQACHAPLTEQHPILYTKEEVDGKKVTVGVENPNYQPELRERGITCAACHVREWTRHGPPAETEPNPEGAHGGFVPREEYEDSRFCYQCHDFKPGKRSLSDKLIQETYGEWRRTKYAAEGIHCQDCHMPEGRHLFKGIHDHDMVREAFTAEAAIVSVDTDQINAKLTITNTGAGHRFPTYVTPQVNLVIWQENAAGEPIEGTQMRDAVARKIAPNVSTEYFDTRLMPDESYTLAYEHERHPDSVALQAAVEVWPDEGYTIFYRLRIKNGAKQHPNTLPLIQEALDHSLASRFTAWEERLELN